MTNIVVFASGSGTNFQAIIDAVESGQINGRIAGLITNKSGIQAIERAQKHDIEHRLLAPSQFSDRSRYINTLLDQLTDWETDLIVLAGYMLKIPPKVIEQFRGRIVNIHPSLLPKYGGKGFYGMRVHQAVIDNNEDKSGCTVHLVTEKYDDGPILGQRKVPVKDSDDADTLADRILKEEHKLFPEIIAQLTDKLNSKSNN
ncbi:formyltetrahydrofolate-dependent phosphoribosylglycinamide formyltransferase [Fodinibius salinus]|uniref:Phosphoribosylglycinamide formyltransferase n=1 Tax=Fodinibius salinus TaxID=860790 RepID=A0A5D3YH50_9BACT|nr:phosphoribosylglycinamide formyltransferase [Fodinibius salinus]TYP92607.1 formyltetrahydrofolate-dependent phosphoribosylglycinamide formyltransferase [Fodinibius salinus]